MIVDYIEDGQPLTQLRLVVQGDVKRGRYTSELTDLNLVDLGAN